MRLIAFPNKSLFRFTTPMYIYVSRNDQMKSLEKKVSMSLTNYLYTVMKNKDSVIRNLRIWKSADNNLETILELDQKIKNYSEVKINATLVNVDDNQETVFDDLNVMDEDIFVIELPKSESNFVFKA